LDIDIEDTMRTLFIMFTLGLTASWLQADSLVLQNGQTLEGVFLGGDSRSVRFAAGDLVHTYSLGEIKSIEFGRSSPASAPAMSSAAPIVSANVATLPAGTQIEVRLIDAVDSKKDSVGQTYRASLARAVTIGTQIMAPIGSDVTLTLIDRSLSGRITGKTSLELAMKNIKVAEETYEVAASSVSRSSGSRTTKSAEVVGGTAALGTLLGAIAGGGKGAAIGALSGGAVGTTAQVVTSGERVRVPSETRLLFTLSNPITLKSSR
jgi:hypothetical protein